jgi:hypothetical protein
MEMEGHPLKGLSKEKTPPPPDHRRKSRYPLDTDFGTGCFDPFAPVISFDRLVISFC